MKQRRQAAVQLQTTSRQTTDSDAPGYVGRFLKTRQDESSHECCENHKCGLETLGRVFCRKAHCTKSMKHHGLLILLLVFTACAAPPESREDFNLTTPLLLQVSTERTFRDVRLEELAPLLPPDSLHWPGSTRLMEHGIFVIEYSDARVWLYDFEGNIQQTFGAGKGEGPGEMLNPIDMVVLGDTVAILDAYSISIHRFLMDGTFVESHAMENQGFRMTSSGSTTLVLVTNPERPIVRYPFVTEDTLVTLFKDVGRMDVFKTLGTLASDDEQFVFTHSFSPFFAVLSPSGEVQFARATIDDGAVEEPYVSAAGEQGVRFPPPLNRGVSVSSGQLYVENGPSRTDSSFVVDVYDLEDEGAYLYSLRMPFRGTGVSVRGDMMAVRTGQVTASLFRFDVE